MVRSLTKTSARTILHRDLSRSRPTITRRPVICRHAVARRANQLLRGVVPLHQGIPAATNAELAPGLLAFRRPFARSPDSDGLHGRLAGLRGVTVRWW